MKRRAYSRATYYAEIKSYFKVQELIMLVNKYIEFNKYSTNKYGDLTKKIMSSAKIPVKYYDDFSDNKKQICAKKVEALFNKLLSLDMDPVDAISYITQIKHSLFDKTELKNHVKIEYLGKKNGIDSYPIAVFYVRLELYENKQMVYVYDSVEKTITEYEYNEYLEFYNSQLEGIKQR